MWRGAGRTDVMLRGALLAALSEKTVLVVMLTDHDVRAAKDMLARIAARRTSSPAAIASAKNTKDAIDRIAFASVDDEEKGFMRGRSFDVRVADHAVLAEKLRGVDGADWLR